jgi:chorismate-pyruvate lyase
VGALRPPLVRRRVIMRGGSGGPPLMYAVSWWNAEDYRARMPDPGLPIGRSLGAQRTELHRTLHAVLRGRGGAELTRALGAEAGQPEEGAQPRGATEGEERAARGAGAASGDLWARYYTVRHAGRPLSVICEVFSPRLCAVLGPQ